MKDVKEKDFKKKPVSKANTKVNVEAKPSAKKPGNTKRIKDEGVVVKEVKLTTVEYVEEEEDKRLIVIVAIAVLLIMAVIMGLLVGCTKEDKKPTKPEPTPVVPEKPANEEANVKKPVRRVSAKAEEKPVEEEKINMYAVKFLFNNQTLKYMEVEEDSLVTPYVPSGYNACVYYEDDTFENEFNFKNRINKDTNIYTVCEVDNYTINYDTETDNVTEYNLGLGVVALDAPTVEMEVPFVSWYLDEDFTKPVKELNKDVIKYADSEKVINLYARFEDLGITYFDDNKEKAAADTDNIINDVRGVCSEGALLGWNSDPVLRNVEYKFGEEVELHDNLNLYPVCGSAAVVYVSNDEEVTIAYTEEELEEYILPEPKEVGLEVPTYYVPVEEKTETSKKVVPNEAIDLLDNEITLDEANLNAGTDFEFAVGDNVEEHNKVFVGWTEKDDTLLDPELDPELEGEEEIEVLPEDYVPKNNAETTLEAQYREQTPEELESGIYDMEEPVVEPEVIPEEI